MSVRVHHYRDCTIVCRQCGHQWTVSREVGTLPRVCPDCHQRWDRPYSLKGKEKPDTVFTMPGQKYNVGWEN